MNKRIISHNDKLAKKSGLGRKFFDHQGTPLRKGDTVKLLTLPLEYSWDLLDLSKNFKGGDW